MERVGVVAELFRFPVKSMRAEPVEAAGVWWYGLMGDRRYAFVRSGNYTSFPWLTAREVPAMVRFRSYLADPSDARNCQVNVVTPDGVELPVESDDLRAILERQYGAPIHLHHVNRGTPDAGAVSVVGQPTIEELCGRLSLPSDSRRFRQNVVIQPDAGEPGVEDRWVGRLLAFGDAESGAAVRLNRPDARCMMVNLDPETATQQPAVLRDIARRRENTLGVYGSVERLGTIRVGDPVFVG